MLGETRFTLIPSKTDELIWTIYYSWPSLWNMFTQTSLTGLEAVKERLL